MQDEHWKFPFIRELTLNHSEDEIEAAERRFAAYLDICADIRKRRRRASIVTPPSEVVHEERIPTQGTLGI